MHFVKTEDLRPGMRLAKPIYNRLGVLLYERNTKLTPQGINSIRKFSLIGIYVLEPAEPLPPLSEEELRFEQFQTMYMFRLRDELGKLINSEAPDKLYELCKGIVHEFGNLDHKIIFSQNIRSSGDFIYKHGLSTGILCAMLTHHLEFSYEEQIALVEAALLFDTGYLYLDSDKLTDFHDIHSSDYKKLCTAREKAFMLLKPQNNEYHLPEMTLKIILEMIHPANHMAHPDMAKRTWLFGTQVLRVADCFDQMTAMRYGFEPQSEIQTMKYLFDHPDFFDSTVVQALAECIHILPQGACVDLTSGDKALILETNPNDFLQPLILRFSDNQIYDLSNPDVAEKFQIKDLMKTMDNRIHVDEDTLKQYQTDSYITEMMNRFRKVKARIAKKLKKPASSAVSKKGIPPAAK